MYVDDLLGTLRERGLDLRPDAWFLLVEEHCFLENIWRTLKRPENAYSLRTSVQMQKDTSCFIRYRRKAGKLPWKKRIRL